MRSGPVGLCLEAQSFAGRMRGLIAHEIVDQIRGLHASEVRDDGVAELANALGAVTRCGRT